MSHEDKDIIAIFRSKGYRVTPQRLIVLDAVCSYQGHATIADIQTSVNYMDASIDPSTVYRALTILRDIGLIIESDIEGSGKVYRIAGEADHHHLVCMSCGQVLTIAREDVEPLFRHFFDEYEFEVQTEHLVFKGICKDCKQDS